MSASHAISRRIRTFLPEEPVARILVIEKDLEIALLYKKYFTRKCYEVFVAADVKEGIVLFDSRDDIDVVFLELDLGEGKMAGEEWLLWFFEHKQDSEAKVIVCTESRRALHATKGANGLCTVLKPFPMNDLQDTVEALLSPDWTKKFGNVQVS